MTNQRLGSSLPAALALCAGLLATPCYGGPIDAALAISASFDLGPNSVDPEGIGTTRTGTLSFISGGVTEQTTIDGTDISGALPLSGAWTHSGDGFLADLAVAGSGIDAISALTIGDPSLPPDFGAVTLTNTDPLRFFDVIFSVVYDLAATADGADFLNTDATSAARFEILDQTLLSLIDRLVEADSFGGPPSASAGASTQLSLSVGPGETLSLIPDLDVFGVVGLFGFGAADDSFSADADLSFRLISATPREAPLPPTWLLVALGLPFLGSSRLPSSR